MKKTIILLFIIFTCNIMNAQEKNKKQFFFIGIGKPWFPDKDHNLKNYTLSINYQNRFAESFALEGFYTYAQSNNYPSFINNPQQLDQFLRAQKRNDILFNSFWSEIYTHSIGAKIHFSFVNNKKFFFSFNFSSGMMFSKSSIHNVLSFEYNQQTGAIINYTNEFLKDTDAQIFYGPGLQFQYTLPSNYIIGLEAMGYFARQKEKNGIITIPVITNYYNLSILVGKKF
jgi:hypothetical protein